MLLLIADIYFYCTDTGRECKEELLLGVLHLHCTTIRRRFASKTAVTE
jgi:hypothetical protein